MYWFVNYIPGIEDKRYLELGIYTGENFRAVAAKDKVSVDTWDGGKPTYQMTTDEYFAQLPAAEQFDVIFIDACHEFHQVLRDFNHSVEHLAPGGLIYCHDVAPNKAEYVTEQNGPCGDCYKLCWLAAGAQRELGYRDWAIYQGDAAGAAVFFSPPQLSLSHLPADTSWAAFDREFSPLAYPTYESFVTLFRKYGV